ncbi:MAG: phasin [Rhodospirillales bacterium]|jgi:phasin family protein|nr:phasin [Rhodospirillales bacterium]
MCGYTCPMKEKHMLKKADAVTKVPNEFLDLTKQMKSFGVPGINVEAVVASQQKNVDAITQANQLAIEGAQALFRRQTEIARSAIEDFSSMFRDFMQSAASPENKIATQAQHSKVAIEKGMASARELADLAIKANTEAFNVIGNRVAETLDEVRDYARNRTA